MENKLRVVGETIDGERSCDKLNVDAEHNNAEEKRQISIDAFLGRNDQSLCDNTEGSTPRKSKGVLTSVVNRQNSEENKNPNKLLSTGELEILMDGVTAEDFDDDW